MHRFQLALHPSVFLLAAIICGCSRETESVAPAKAPRPVSVIRLMESDPARSLSVTGIVGSWKTEEIGFEVSGRVQYVIEPETNVMGTARNGTAAQPLARLDVARFETAVASANARIDALLKQKKAAEIQLGQVLPAQRTGAVAAQELAQADFDRAKEAFDKGAIAKSEQDQYVANLTTAKAKVAQLDATGEAQSAEIASLEAQIEEARAALQDAALDLKDCTLYAPFRGQIAKVHSIPGGTVQRGEKVVTVQMMDPMKVEFEVSAERVRQMHYKDPLNVILTRADGADLVEEGIIYTTDAVADPSTRTFTITLLIRNQQVPAIVPGDVDTDALAKTRDIWACIRGIIDDSDEYYVEQNAIHRDDQGDYLWKIIEPTGNSARSRGPLLTVKKVRVKSGDQRTNFLGLWTFRNVTINDSEEFDIERDRVIGKLVLPEGATELAGDTVLFEREQWQFRPGDLVRIDLNEGRMSRGVYVPIDAINESSGKHYVFVVDGSDASSKVRKTEVAIFDGPNTQKRIEPVDGTSLAGRQIVQGGVHYLVDGESVNVASEVEGN
ncbi:MAG: HlyD family efflux transporter periplasmic adaptor subunit [Rhodopirellula sp.]|nr:HlyD family efflux transporter periplasmic adaptor subunit [Rhodopirellula sp.]